MEIKRNLNSTFQAFEFRLISLYDCLRDCLEEVSRCDRVRRVHLCHTASLELLEEVDGLDEEAVRVPDDPHTGGDGRGRGDKS